MVRCAANVPWGLRAQMVEDGILQTEPRESTGLNRANSDREVLLPAIKQEAPSIDPTTAFDKMVRTLPTSFIKAMARGQANNNDFYNKTAKTWKRKENYVPLSERESTEWDVRLDITPQLTATAIVEAAKAHKDQILWGLVSGIEYGKSRHDRQLHGQWIAESEQFHVHVAVVLNKKAKREEVLKLFREHKSGGEYCKPRDQSQTYAGWRMHHCKEATKIDDTQFLWEYGTRPIDLLTEENGRKALAMRRLYGRPSDDLLYEVLLDVGRRVANKSESERKRAQRDELEELRAEVKRLRESIQQ
uniref:Replication-associated protein n=1 Tax=Ciconia boyciana CRESS-DNA-virus sp. TaxID=2815024 RepID=A0A8A4XCA4_9VIRU|nr:MAG: replication-associated protein [Ciconia boyciana CRESS-DNA-virus sp.]